MATDVHAEAIRIRAQLSDLLRRVPDKVNNGGHGTAVLYKKAAAKAQQVLVSPRANLLALTTSRNSMLSFQ